MAFVKQSVTLLLPVTFLLLPPTLVSSVRWGRFCLKLGVEVHRNCDVCTSFQAPPRRAGWSRVVAPVLITRTTRWGLWGPYPPVPIALVSDSFCSGVGSSEIAPRLVVSWVGREVAGAGCLQRSCHGGCRGFQHRAAASHWGLSFGEALWGARAGCPQPGS